MRYIEVLFYNEVIYRGTSYKEAVQKMFESSVILNDGVLNPFTLTEHDTEED